MELSVTKTRHRIKVKPNIGWTLRTAEFLAETFREQKKNPKKPTQMIKLYTCKNLTDFSDKDKDFR